MRINISDICYAIKFEISNDIIMLKFFQQLRYGKKDTSCLIVKIVFIKIWQILPDDISILTKIVFKNF